MDSSADVVTRYYELANAGDWSRWCDLFAEDLVMDEQIAGHIEGQRTLREMMKGFPRMYESYANKPARVVITDDQAAVVSHISATTAGGQSIEADVCNYFEISGGKISYFANFHDTVPFSEVAAR